MSVDQAFAVVEHWLYQVMVIALGLPVLLSLFVLCHLLDFAEVYRPAHELYLQGTVNLTNNVKTLTLKIIFCICYEKNYHNYYKSRSL